MRHNPELRITKIVYSFVSLGEEACLDQPENVAT